MQHKPDKARDEEVSLIKPETKRWMYMPVCLTTVERQSIGLAACLLTLA